MPRRPNSERRVEWKISVNAELAAEVQIAFINPLTGRAGYGSRSELVEHLIRLWLQGGDAAVLAHRQEIEANAPIG